MIYKFTGYNFILAFWHLLLEKGDTFKKANNCNEFPNF